MIPHFRIPSPKIYGPLVIHPFDGFIGRTIGALIYFRQRHVPLLQYADALMFGLAPTWIIGRLGCTVVFDHPGARTDFFLGMADQWGVVRHNLGFYEMLLAIFLSIILYAIRNVRPFAGFHTATMLILYSPARFFLDSLRIADKTYYGLTPGQYFSVVMFALGFVLLLHGATGQRDYGGEKSKESAGCSQ